MDKQDFLQRLTDEYCSLQEVTAVGIGGSSSGNLTDSLSDIDYYLFVEQAPDLNWRKKLVQRMADKYEVGEQYFGDGDEYFAKDINTELDVMFFSRSWFEDNIRSVWQKFQASNGYTTCFAYTMSKLLTLRDDKGWIREMKEILATSYPAELQENIIRRNISLICDKPFSSYYDQIKVALERNDHVSINHRSAALLASYFDVLFARNQLLHPGEKRLIQFAENNCKILPEDFAEDVKNFCICSYGEKLSTARKMIEALKKIL